MLWRESFDFIQNEFNSFESRIFIDFKYDISKLCKALCPFILEILSFVNVLLKMNLFYFQNKDIGFFLLQFV